MKAKDMAKMLMEHPEAEVDVRGSFGEAGFGHNMAPIYVAELEFQMVAWMGCPNPEVVGRPTFTILKGKRK